MPATWVTPKLVAEIRFNEWTSAGKLRHPVFLGLRDDKDPTSVRREPAGEAAPEPPELTTPSRPRPPGAAATDPGAGDVAEQLRAIEADGGDGAIALPDGRSLAVTNLAKVFFPCTGATKGDLLRYYAAMAELVLPAMADRPLVLKRFPNGITGKSFYQQSADRCS